MMSEQEIDPTDDDIIEDDENDVGEDNEDDIEDEVIEDNIDDLDSVDNDDDEVEIMSQSDASDNEVEVTSPLATSDELDIDAALAAVSQLTLLTQDEPDATDEISDYHDDSDEVIEEFHRESSPEPEFTVEFEQPRDLSMSRGQLASVIPALTLIILGGWLTFTFTTSDTALTVGLLFPVVLIAIGVIFLSQWLTSARWSRGNFFFGSSALLIGGVQLYLSQVTPDIANNGWSLWVVALGVAMFGTGYIALPRLPRLSIMGFLTIIAGAIGYILTSGTLDPSVIKFIGNLWFVGVAIIVFMMIAPMIRRRQ
jgi:hypothetical protein